MKPRHAAALALVGWYLMVPPHWNDSTPQAPTVFDRDVPLREWMIIQPFHTEADCQDYRTERWTQCGKCGLELLWVTSKCIATDDPRLKGSALSHFVPPN